MIQDIFPKHFDNTYRNLKPNPTDTVLCYRKNQVLCRRMDDGTILYPSFSEIGGESDDAVYLFSIDEERFFRVPWAYAKIPTGYHLEDVRIFREAVPRYYGFAGVTGLQLHRWYRTHQFCGRCATAMKHDEKERMMFCPNCGNQIFPTISPAVIVGVVDKEQDRLLLTRYAGGASDYRKYALVAGFAEVGESIEETVHREVLEETGVRVKNLKFYKTQPWSFSSTLLFGFWAELDGDDTITLQEELSEGVFMKAEEIPASEDGEVSLTWEMIEQFRNGYRP